MLLLSLGVYLLFCWNTGHRGNDAVLVCVTLAGGPLLPACHQCSGAGVGEGRISDKPVSLSTKSSILLNTVPPSLDTKVCTPPMPQYSKSHGLGPHLIPGCLCHHAPRWENSPCPLAADRIVNPTQCRQASYAETWKTLQTPRLEFPLWLCGLRPNIASMRMHVQSLASLCGLRAQRSQTPSPLGEKSH